MKNNIMLKQPVSVSVSVSIYFFLSFYVLLCVYVYCSSSIISKTTTGFRNPLLLKPDGPTTTGFRNPLLMKSDVTFPAHRRSYSTSRSYSSYDFNFTNEELDANWAYLQGVISDVRCKKPYPGSVYASMDFNEPYPRTIDFNILTLAYMQLLESYAFTIASDYIKFTIGYNMRSSTSTADISFTLGNAIPLFDVAGNGVSRNIIYSKIYDLVKCNGEKYEDAFVKGVFVRIFFESKGSPVEFPTLAPSDLKAIIHSVVIDQSSENPPDVKSLLFKKSRISTRIKALKSKTKECRPFIVADLETILEDNVHYPYAAGYLVVNPGDDLCALPSYAIPTFFSESHKLFYPNFKERSSRMLFEFLSHLEVSVKQNPLVRTIYFHNFSRFDGIFLLRYYADRGNVYKLKTLMRNHRLYELKVYIDSRLLFRFRDSLTLLPGSLASLGKTLCPELGSKGSIDHESLSVSNIHSQREDLLDYLRQDVLLLGGVICKAQEIYKSKYQIDIEDVMTLSSLALKIFRQHFFDDSAFHINIPNRNQDTFIRRGYTGGHVDVYKPYGENLYHYDVNSLYPFVMKAFPMPSGEPVWRNSLQEVELDSLFGFVEAYVVCPEHIKRPFLPYKDSSGTLLFPTGKFISVFYTEELKFAKQLGYEVIPLRGYLFEKKESPFKGFISELYKCRQESKKAGNDALTYIYKILMNTLYGRFGMNPESTVTEICNQTKYEELLKKDNFQSAEKLTDHYYIVNYTTNKSFSDSDDVWEPPKMMAVQLSAAITACARIHMYPYLSRSDCYYTDTDSVVLGSPLPDDLVSSSELGMFKLEGIAKTGIFLAPKSYVLEMEDSKQIIKHKGPAKNLVTYDWFKEVLGDMSLTEQVSTSANFRIDWKKLQIGRKDIMIKLALPKSTKREMIFDSNNIWVDTKPIDVIDLGNQDVNTIFRLELSKKKDESLSQPTTYKTKQEAKKAKIPPKNPPKKDEHKIPPKKNEAKIPTKKKPKRDESPKPSKKPPKNPPKPPKKNKKGNRPKPDE